MSGTFYCPVTIGRRKDTIKRKSNYQFPRKILLKHKSILLFFKVDLCYNKYNKSENADKTVFSDLFVTNMLFVQVNKFIV